MPKLLISIRFSKKDEILQFCVICLFAHSVRVTIRAVQCRVTDIVTAPYATYAILRGTFFFTHTRNVYLSKANPSKMQKKLNDTSLSNHGDCKYFATITIISRFL